MCHAYKDFGCRSPLKEGGNSVRKEKIMKYYAVKVGVRTGVFTSWEECQKAVDGFSGAKFKKFRSLEEAERFIHEDNDSKPIKEDLVDGYINKLAIHHDYEGVGAWADDVWKAKLPETKAYRGYVFDSREVLDIKFIKEKDILGMNIMTELTI